jgi:hypothetical protein
MVGSVSQLGAEESIKGSENHPDKKRQRAIQDSIVEDSPSAATSKGNSEDGGTKSHGRIGLAMCLSRKGSARRLLEARFQTGTVCSVLEQFVLAASSSKYSAGVRDRSRKRIAARRNNEPQARLVLTLLISRGYRAF